MPPDVPSFDPALTVVAIGASAGGLEALRQFFGAATTDARLAYVVVTHLPQHHISYLPELLQRAGALPVHEAQPGERLAGGAVYVLPPGRRMLLSEGALVLESSTAKTLPVLKPIDLFMTSVADDVADRSVGIVLSGTDHDGTVGLKAIKTAGGFTLVQSPETAEFPSMPESAISAGAADRVLPPAAMPAAVLDCVAHGPSETELGPITDDAALVDDGLAPDRLNDILAVVLAQTGNDFRWYRPAMLRRRLRRRMVLLGIARLADYAALLDTSPTEAHALSGEFLIGVTDFFRDPDAWQAIAEKVLPAMLAERGAGDPPFRVWSAGCSTGEESYSIAMLLLEQLGTAARDNGLQVFGTDIDLDALAVARQGVYPLAIAATVSPARLVRFFEQRDGHYVVRKALRERVMFAPQNLVHDTPFSRLDLVLCRNLLMYFDPALQERALQLFHFALKPRGLLWLGKAESLAAHGALFEPVIPGLQLFRRVGGRAHLPPGFAVGGAPPEWKRRVSDRVASLAETIDAQLGGRRVDAAVLVDREGRALHFHGDAAPFLAPAGDATLELQRLVRPELRTAVRSLLRQAALDKSAATRAVRLDGVTITLTAAPADDRDRRGLVVVTFDGKAAAASAAPVVGGAVDGAPRDHELEASRRELAAALEEAERTNEELRLAHEEGSSLNEELQSSNEELESSKEELQSLNEELATVNAQLEEKIVEVERGANDLTNLLDSTHIATLLLDREMRIRRFTPAAAELFSLRPGDEGRQLTDMHSHLDDATFAADAQRVLESQVPCEAEVRTASGAALLRRILPYRTGAGATSGIVATFVDITPLRAADRQARELAAILDGSNDAIFRVDLRGRILAWNKGAERTYGWSREKALATDVFALSPAAQREATLALIEQARADGSAGPLEVQRIAADGRVLRVSSTVSALRDDRGDVYALLATERDMTERLRVELEVRFRRLVDDIPALLRVEDLGGIAQFVNRACVEFTGQPREMLMGLGWLQFVHPVDRAAYIEEHAGAGAAHARRESDFRLRRHDGVYRWMRSISVAHNDPEGQFAGYVSLMLDVEDRKNAESALQTADRRKDDFLATLSHELRNPLAPIGNAARLIAQTGSHDEQARWAAEVIERQTGVMARLLDDLLDVARVTRGKTTLALAPVDVSVVVQRAVEMSKPLMEARRQRLIVNLPPERISVEGDLLRLVQVLANLLNNASKYTQYSGEITVGCEATGAEVVIRVSDNGAGIAADMLPRVFDRFAQAENTLDRSTGGLGLGLTLVRHLVRLHGGSVTAESKGLGEGSTFTVHLPRLASEPVTAKSAVAPASASNGKNRRRRVLVVDDNVDGRKTLARILEMEGHLVQVAGNGLDALALAERATPDIVILDIGLPGMDGYQVARRLRGRAATAHIPIVAVTGYGRPEDVAAAREAGIDRHLVKPVAVEALLATVAAAPPGAD